MQATTIQTRRTLEFGIYRDGDNNLDYSQAQLLEQAQSVSAHDSKVVFTVEDTTSRHSGSLETDNYRLRDGMVVGEKAEKGLNMASRANLAAFVARTLDNAEADGVSRTWIELCDHGAGDGGGLEADSAHALMSSDDIAAAISDGIALHARAHPEDSGRSVDGVVANQCLMASLGFADALSHAGVRYLAASPETMLSPGTTTKVADAIAADDEPVRLATDIVKTVMSEKFHGIGQPYGAAAAFDVLDLSDQKWNAVEKSVKALNDAIAQAGKNDDAQLREIASQISGMVRFPESTPDMPWKADRPAIKLYDAIAKSTVSNPIKQAAAAASRAISDTVLAHSESSKFAPFDGSDYRDAVGPTVHFAINKAQIDPWAPVVSETKTAFFKAVDGLNETNAVVA